MQNSFAYQQSRFMPFLWEACLQANVAKRLSEPYSLASKLPTAAKDLLFFLFSAVNCPLSTVN
ncbi:hypothetical protein [Alcanivorax sp. 24]|uniref:hypothetical protein n=1 Tax=Alcanivorax sp. 24 TaxID=2545266 RepID=UPI00106147C5|nr:hypothetical protein [Alcanivorax sp. 24]